MDLRHIDECGEHFYFKTGPDAQVLTTDKPGRYVVTVNPGTDRCRMFIVDDQKDGRSAAAYAVNLYLEMLEKK